MCAKIIGAVTTVVFGMDSVILNASCVTDRMRVIVVNVCCMPHMMLMDVVDVMNFGAVIVARCLQGHVIRSVCRSMDVHQSMHLTVTFVICTQRGTMIRSASATQIVQVAIVPYTLAYAIHYARDALALHILNANSAFRMQGGTARLHAIEKQTGPG